MCFLKLNKLMATQICCFLNSKGKVLSERERERFIVTLHKYKTLKISFYLTQVTGVKCNHIMLYAYNVYAYSVCKCRTLDGTNSYGIFIMIGGQY